jgi:hypothetical protein
MRLMLAFRVFFRVLFSAAVAERVTSALSGRTASIERTEPAAEKAAEKALEKKTERRPVVPPAPARSEALTLLAALQREARLVDIVREPLAQYSDAQIGAAARDVLRDCGAVIERMFALQPVVPQQEGAEVEVPAGFDPGCYRLTGNVTGEPPFHGRLMHHGWQATRCELPSWSGGKDAAKVVAAAEVELG